LLQRFHIRVDFSFCFLSHKKRVLLPLYFPAKKNISLIQYYENEALTQTGFYILLFYPYIAPPG